jgi:hypothetical protein
MRDPWDRVVAVGRAGIYESHYLKANSPDGRRALWLKHTLLRPLDAPAIAEFWAVCFERGQPPIVVKREVAWGRLLLNPKEVEIEADGVRLTSHHASGALADVSWSLRVSGGLAPLMHFRHDWMYTGGFPKKKILTPAPNLRFDGELQVGGQTWAVDGWRGIRGHNWGAEHAWSYAYGSCNLWDDGAERAVDGFSARVLAGGRRMPWLSAVVGHNPFVRQNGLRTLRATQTRVDSSAWSVGWRQSRGGVRLSMHADPEGFAGLRYRHPDGRESFCYNSKFAATELCVRGGQHHSQLGELELLFAEPLDGIPLHPAPGWIAEDGDYRSEA